MSNANHKPPEKLFSEDLRATAEALKHIRTALVGLVNEGAYPQGTFEDMSIVLNEGWHVVEALELLANN